MFLCSPLAELYALNGIDAITYRDNHIKIIVGYFLLNFASEATFYDGCKFCNCHKCLSFWATLGVLWWLGCDVVTAMLLSLAMAYLSNWFGILLVWLNRQYTELWERINRKKKAHR